MADKIPAWFERDTKSVAQEGIAQQARTNWRKVTITSDPTNGDIVLEYHMPNGVPDSKRYSQAEFLRQGMSIARVIGFHVTP
jgi:hypothetical protein